MAVGRRRRLIIISQVVILQHSLPRCVSAASSIRSIATTSCNPIPSHASKNEKTGFRHRSRRLFRGSVNDDTTDACLLNHTVSSRSNHPQFSPRALQSSLQTMIVDNPLEKTIRMGMRNSVFLFGEGHRRLRRQRRRRQISSMVSPTIESKKMQMYLTCFAIVFAWISLGTLFYSYYYQWPLPQSFFYAVDAGMSIGFCTDVAETKVASRAFTVVHILLGASCVGGALVLLVQDVLEGVASRSAAEYKVILERDSMRKAFFGYGGTGGSSSGADGLPNVRQFKLNPLSKRYAEGILSYDDFRDALTKNGLSQLTDREFQRVCNFYDPDREGCIRYDYFADNFRGMHRIQRVSRSSIYEHYNGKSFPSRTVARVYDVLSSRRHRIYLIFVSWIGMGILWGIFDQGWDPITATHFAVSALATGGLTAPPVDAATGILPTGPALFCGFYCLFGIPLMALTLGIFARVLVEGYIVEEELASMARPLSSSEFLFARQSLRSHNHPGYNYFDDSNEDGNGVMIQLSDYIVLQLMRQGKLSLESFQVMQRQYQMLDQQGDNDFWWKRKRVDDA